MHSLKKGETKGEMSLNLFVKLQVLGVSQACTALMEVNPLDYTIRDPKLTPENTFRERDLI